MSKDTKSAAHVADMDVIEVCDMAARWLAARVSEKAKG